MRPNPLKDLTQRFLEKTGDVNGTDLSIKRATDFHPSLETKQNKIKNSGDG